MSKRICNRPVRVGSLVLIALLVSSATADYLVQDNVAFNAKKINPYTGGPAWVWEDSYTLLDESFGPVTIGPLDGDPLGTAVEALFGVDLPHLVKLKAGASLSGQANVNFGYYVTGGRLDISYPATANLNFDTEAGTANVVRANQAYGVDGSFLPGVSQRSVLSEFLTTQGGAGYATAPLRSQTQYQAPWFETESPHASAWIEASANVQASIFTKASAIGGLVEWRKDIRAGGQVGGRLLEIDPTGLWVAGSSEPVVDFNIYEPIGPFPIGGGLADLTFQVPNIAVSSVSHGGAQGSVITARKEQPVATLTGNLERLIPFVGNILQHEIGPLGYDLLNLAGGPQLSLYQEMTFTPDPKVRLTFSEPVIVAGNSQPTVQAEFDLDEAISWRPMFSNSSTIQVTPTYLLENSFRNETGLKFELVVDVEALSITADFPPFNGTVGPAYSETVTIPIGGDIELFTQEFNIPLGSTMGGSLPGVGPITTGVITFQKSNLDIEPGLGDLNLVTANFVGPDQSNPGYSLYNLDFTRSVDGGTPRQYNAQVSAQEDFWDPEGKSYLMLTTAQDVVLTDQISGQTYNVGKNFCAEPGGCDLSDLLPSTSPEYVDPNPSLGSLYVTRLPDDLSFVPNVDIVDAGHQVLDQYNSVDDFILNSSVEESTQFVDRAAYPSSTILVQTGEVIPDGIGRFHSPNFVPLGMNVHGDVAFFSPLADVPPGTGGNGYYAANEANKLKLARFGELVPDANGTIAFHPGMLASVNDLGQGALVADIANSPTTTQGLFRTGPTGLTTIALAGVSLGGTIQQFTTAPTINETGQVLFSALVADGTPFPKQAIFVGNGSVLSEIVREGNFVLGMAARIAGLESNSINDSGSLAFLATSELGEQGIYRGSSDGRTAIASSGGFAPQGGQFVTFGTPVINEPGQIAFSAFVQSTPGGPLNSALYRGDGSSINRIAAAGQLAPSGDGVLNQQLSFLQLNDLGQAVFRAGVDAAVDYEAILMGNGGSLSQIARYGTVAANGGNPISLFFGAPLLNNQGHVAFQDYRLPENERGIFVYDGTNVVQIVRPGQPLAGSSVRDANLVDINDDMQVAYSALLTDGRQIVARFEPSIYWRNSSSGNWSTPTNWSLGIAPSSPYDVTIVAENAITVTGPNVNSTMKSLVVGADDSANITLDLVSGVTLTATNGTTVRPNGILTGHGGLAGAVTNEGTISPGALPGILQINGDYTQSPTGDLLIEIASPTDFDRLIVSGALTLDGTLAVSLLGGFTPALGQQFAIFGDQLDSVAGEFDLIVAPVFNGLTFNVVQSANTFLLQVGAAPTPGDFDRDGDVDGRDFLVWQRNPSVGTLADWKANFGASTVVTAVPEPACAELLAFGALGATLLRRRSLRGRQLVPPTNWQCRNLLLGKCLASNAILRLGSFPRHLGTT